MVYGVGVFDYMVCLVQMVDCGGDFGFGYQQYFVQQIVVQCEGQVIVQFDVVVQIVGQCCNFGYFDWMVGVQVGGYGGVVFYVDVDYVGCG